MSHHSKTSWPEVEGLPAEVAKHKILADRPDVQVVVVPDGSYVTTDFNDKRRQGRQRRQGPQDRLEGQ